MKPLRYFFGLSLYLLVSCSPYHHAYTNTLTICPSSKNCHHFNVEIADTAYTRKHGLMHRKELAPFNGMLFVYPWEYEVSMWMKNTLIPLDILFINAQHRIVHIEENTKPLSLIKISSTLPAKFVLELNAGTVKKLNINTQSTVSLP